MPIVTSTYKGEEWTIIVKINSCGTHAVEVGLNVWAEVEKVDTLIVSAIRGRFSSETGTFSIPFYCNLSKEGN